MSLRHLVAVSALAVLLTGCSDDEPEPKPKDQPSASDTPNPDATLPATVVRAVTPSHLDAVCPNGQFTEADGVLGTLPETYAEQATQLLTYDCEGLIDRVIWAELPDAEVAAELLDPETAEGADVFVAGNTVVAVAARVVDEAGLDVEAYFQDLTDNCGCGTYEITSGP